MEEPRAEKRQSGPFDTTPYNASSRFGDSAIAMPEELFTDPVPPTYPDPARTTPDHTPAFTDAIRPQRATAQLPEDWAREFEDQAPTARADPFTEPRDAPVPSASLPQRPPAPSEGGLLAAFLEGAGLSDVVPQDPLAAMRNAGAAFRAFAAGLREALMVRAEIKSAMRIDPTMMRSQGNNPLKFSAGDDDALLALLGSGRRTTMTPQAAVAEALRDLRHHEQAILPAVQTALRTLLDRLEPAAFRAAAEQGGLALRAQRRARAFELMDAEYRKLRADLADDFDRAFGQTFAVAYEAVIDDLRKMETKP